MGPEQLLPLPKEFTDLEFYQDSLLEFATESEPFQKLCGGVYILDFFTSEPDIYSIILPEDWRSWFKTTDVQDIIYLLVREDMTQFDVGDPRYALGAWKGGTLPPSTLIQYIKDVRRHCLDRDVISHGPRNRAKTLSRNIALGMKPKKIHEVDSFTRWVNQFTGSLVQERDIRITHVVDFGSGQNFLGRALASTPYNNNVIAVESRPHVVQMAKRIDVLARLSEKSKIQVDKKLFRETVATGRKLSAEKPDRGAKSSFYTTSNGYKVQTNDYVETIRATLELPQEGKGSIQYVEHSITNGNLSTVIEQIVDHSSTITVTPPSKHHLSVQPALMVLSIHSCGNLSHHGLRTLTMNPSVQAVAIIGCCYNLLTERLGPATYKHPTLLRSEHPRLESTSNARDPHGFPMSRRFCEYRHPISGDSGQQTGIRFNITSRMMAVQAPANWGRDDSAAFFTRHFYRALLQRIFLDKGVVAAPVAAASTTSTPQGNAGPKGAGSVGASPAGTSLPAGTEPIIIGSLRKTCYRDFVSYVRGAVAKIVSSQSSRAAAVETALGAMTDGEIESYEEAYAARKKELSVTWSLLAFSAGVVESLIVLDRWCWLREQEGVETAWVEALFDYGLSPRNLVVVGVKGQRGVGRKTVEDSSEG